MAIPTGNSPLIQHQLFERAKQFQRTRFIEHNAETILHLAIRLMKDVESYQLLAQLKSYKELELIIARIDAAAAMKPYMPQTRGGNLFDYP